MAAIRESKPRVTRLFRAALSGPRLLALMCLTFAATAVHAADCTTPLARLVLVKGSVELVRQGSPRLAVAESDASLCAGDTVIVHQRGQAALLLSNATVVRLDQGTTVTLSPSTSGRPALLNVISGAIYVISRTPQPFRVRTPFINANVEGTEFLVRVGAEAAEVVVIEGRVVAENEFGSVVVDAGQLARARQLSAPLKELRIQDRDSVQWTLYVPTLWGRTQSPDMGNSPYAPAVQEALALQREGQLDAAVTRLEAVPEASRDQRWELLRAHLMVIAGRLEEARQILERSLAQQKKDQGERLALLSAIALANNEKELALRLARQAVASDASPSGWVALSYAQQAQFDLEAARFSVEKAVALRPENALALSRQAELELALGRVSEAFSQANRAVLSDPALAKAHSVLGFVQLARLEHDAAIREFTLAIVADDADPDGRLGMGLALIREGKLGQGREEIELAAALDPARSLTRTYLGKAYFEESRDVPAEVQWQLAVDRDPLDPTPWFYLALSKQAANRPVEALADMETSLTLNGNRAIYRSILLRDQDEASRTSAKARIYADLGFSRLTLLSGTSAIDEDPASFAAHRLLADAYVEAPRHDIARVSELLQSQLRQPLNFTPTQLELAEDRLVLLRGAGPADVGFNEYNALFTRDGISFKASGILGGNSTAGDQVTVSGIQGRWGYSVGQLSYRTDGFRENDDFRKTLYDAFVQYQAVYDLSFQAEVRRATSRYGDTVLRFDPQLFVSDRNSESSTSYRFGGQYRLEPSSDLLFSFISVDGTFTNGPSGMTVVDQSLRTKNLELQYSRHAELFNLVAGAGANSERNHTEFFGIPSDSRPEALNAYVYGSAKLAGRSVTLHIGTSYDRLRATDSLGKVVHQLNPKFGLMWQPTLQTTVRAAVFRTLKRRFLVSQTLEPTQVAGFNQFYDDLNGTDATRVGVAVDHRFSAELYGGLEISKRKLKVPQDLTMGEVFDWRERESLAYLYWAPDRQLALSARYAYERFDRPADFPGQELFTNVSTQRVPLSVDVRLPASFSARLSATLVRQTGMFYSSSGNPDPEPGASRFWIADASASYRLPHGRGMLSAELKNLFNRKYQYQETDLFNPLLARNRTWFVRATLLFE